MKWKNILGALVILFFFSCNPEGKLPQPDIQDILPSISPDNKHIVFTRVYSNTSEPGINIMDIDGKNLVKIYGNVNNTNFLSLMAASWSPDSKKLAIVKNKQELIIVDKKGNILESGQLINENQYAVLPQWSVDGEIIACSYIVASGETLPIINLLHIYSKRQQQIKLSGAYIWGKISIFDNSKLLYRNEDSAFISDTSGNVLSTFRLKGFTGFYWMNSPVIDTKEKNIYYMDKSTIYSVDLKNQTETIFIENAAMPSFSVDGNFVVFVRPDNHHVNEKIWIKDLQTNNETEINY